MEEKDLRELIRALKKGSLSERQALERLKTLPFADLGHTKVDHHRALRQGAAEVIFAEGKETRDLISIVREMKKNQSEILITRVSDSQAAALKKAFPKARHNARGRTVRVAGRAGGGKRSRAGGGPVAIVSAGTSDAGVVEEARETLEWLGIRADVIADAGVAGIHRVLAHRKLLDRARAVIVVAGMEGALASVVGGLVDKPVIGVPTSVGYGAGAGGLAALMGMLNSCAAGVTVMNIDNGFGAACAAARILRSGRGANER